jgi:hypothetical protein
MFNDNQSRKDGKKASDKGKGKLFEEYLDLKRRIRCGLIGTNEELKELYKKADLVAEIRSRRIGWLGHVIRMEDEKMVRKLFKEKLGGRRRKGRPRLRWIDVVGADLRAMGVRRRRLKAADRVEWAGIAREAEDLPGPQCQGGGGGVY